MNTADQAAIRMQTAMTDLHDAIKSLVQAEMGLSDADIDQAARDLLLEGKISMQTGDLIRALQMYASEHVIAPDED